MSNKLIEKDIITILLQTKPRAKDVRVYENYTFVDGKISFISYKENQEDKRGYVLITSSKKCFCEDISLLISTLNSMFEETNKKLWFNKIFDGLNIFSIISSIIAVVIVFTVCYLAIQNQEIPIYLLSAVLLILGFYFGKKN